MTPRMAGMDVVALFLKAPVSGKVKTRLAAALGDKDARMAYVELVEFLVRRIGNRPLHIHHTPADAGPMREWLGERYVYHAQRGDDLGERLEYAMELEFAGGADRLIFLGGDCPYVDEARLEEAFDSLGDHDVVLGPATDGGYYLIGLKRLLPEVFRNVAWGTGAVFRQTLDICRKNGFLFALLPEEADVDDLKTWEAAKAFMENTCASS